MNNSKKNIWVAGAVILFIFCIYLLTFKSEGYHTFLHWRIFNLNGNCFVYDNLNNAFLDDTSIHIHLCRSTISGDNLNKGTFVIDDYLDVTSLNKNASEGTFYSQGTVLDFLSGPPRLYSSITLYKNLGGLEQTIQTETVLPVAYLQYNQKERTAVVNLSYGEQFDEDIRYVILYGFTDHESAQMYIEKSHS